MATVTLKGNPIHTAGDLPKVGKAAPAFALTGTELNAITQDSYPGKRIVLNIFPSVDTPTCATSVRQFNVRAAKAANTVVLNVSKDLPFAHKRFCAAEGIDKVYGASDFRSPAFGGDYGVTLVDGPIAGLLARSVVVIDEKGIVKYTELVPEIANEPNYDKALAALA
jgi:thiol peroxidase